MTVVQKNGLFRKVLIELRRMGTASTLVAL